MKDTNNNFISKIILLSIFVAVVFPFPLLAMTNNGQTIWRAEVIEVIKEEKTIIPGTSAEANIQTIEIKLLEGEKVGKNVTIENDFITLKKGDKIFVSYTYDEDSGKELYSVKERDRVMILLIFIGLFVLALLIFGRWQSFRALISLAGSIFVIAYVLIPKLLEGYPPVITSVVIAVLILFMAIYFTHGFNRESTVAFLGTVSAVIITGIMTYVSIGVGQFTGFGSEEAIFLSLGSSVKFDFIGLLLGGIIIGVLGILDDIAITQVAVVRELYGASNNLTKGEIFKKAMAVGRDHVGALVNTLFLAYTGASLPLLLVFSTSGINLSLAISQEMFAAEIIRTIMGSIGLVLTVPITTAFAVFILSGHNKQNSEIKISHIH